MVKFFCAPVMAPWGESTVAVVMRLATSSSCSPTAASLTGSICTRTAGFCWPPTDTCAIPGSCESCWAITVSA